MENEDNIVDLLATIRQGFVALSEAMKSTSDAVLAARETAERWDALIVEGVENAIWRIATNATSAPCADFYDAIQKGVADGVRNIDIEGALRGIKTQTER